MSYGHDSFKIALMELEKPVYLLKNLCSLLTEEKPQMPVYSGLTLEQNVWSETFSSSNSQWATLGADWVTYILIWTAYKLTKLEYLHSYYVNQIHCFLPLFSGWFYDWTQTYDIAFYFSGFCVLLGGLILLLAALPSCDTCKKQLPKPAPTTFLYKVASNSSNV